MKMRRAQKILSHEGRYGFMATVMAIMVITCGVMVLMAYALGEWAVSTLAMGYSSMSVSGALAFIISGIILMNRSRKISDADDSGYAIIPIASYILLLLMGSNLLQNYMHESDLTTIFAYDAISISHYGGPSIMSIIMFILIGVANIGNYFEFEGQARVQQQLGAIIAIAGTIVTFGYIAHIPLLYSGMVNFGKPISLLSALLFIALGVGFIFCGLYSKSSPRKLA